MGDGGDGFFELVVLDDDFDAAADREGDDVFAGSECGWAFGVVTPASGFVDAESGDADVGEGGSDLFGAVGSDVGAETEHGGLELAEAAPVRPDAEGVGDEIEEVAVDVGDRGEGFAIAASAHDHGSVVGDVDAVDEAHGDAVGGLYGGDFAQGGECDECDGDGEQAEDALAGEVEIAAAEKTVESGEEGHRWDAPDGPTEEEADTAHAGEAGESGYEKESATGGIEPGRFYGAAPDGQGKEAAEEHEQAIGGIGEPDGGVDLGEKGPECSEDDGEGVGAGEDAGEADGFGVFAPADGAGYFDGFGEVGHQGHGCETGGLRLLWLGATPNVADFIGVGGGSALFFDEAEGAEVIEFGSEEGPGDGAEFIFGGAGAGDDDELSAGGEEAGEGGAGVGAGFGREGLEGEDFDDEIERAKARGGEGEEIGDFEGDFWVEEAGRRPFDGGGGNIEGPDALAAGGDEVGVVAETAADDGDLGVLVIGLEGGEKRVGGEVGPGDEGGFALSPGVKGLEPGGGSLGGAGLICETGGVLSVFV